MKLQSRSHQIRDGHTLESGLRFPLPELLLFRQKMRYIQIRQKRRIFPPLFSKKRHLVISVSSDDDSSSASFAKITTLGDLNTSSVVNAVAAVRGMDTSTDSTIKLKDGDHTSSCTTESVSPHHLAGLSPIKVPSPEVSCDPPITTFVPSIGAWAKPLAFAPPATPPTPSTPSDFDPKYLNNLLNSFWPTLADGTGQSQKKKDQPPAVREFPRIPVKKNSSS